MDFDVVLDRSVGPDVAEEIALLRTAHRFRARGVSQSQDGIRQFVVEVDEGAEQWSITWETGQREGFADGVLTPHHDHLGRLEFVAEWAKR